MMKSEISNLFCLTQFSGFGYHRISKLREVFGSFDQVVASREYRRWGDSGIGRGLFRQWREFSERESEGLEKKLQQMADFGVSLVGYFEERYPERLRQIHSPPPILYYQGNIDILDKKCLAVVGTRKVTDYGRRVVKDIIDRLNGYNWVIISGMALGIDSLAHRAVLAHGGLTVAVVGGSLDKVYPRSNLKLAGQIINSGGLIISEHSWDLKAERWHFPARNRIVSGLSQAVLVIEAPEKSGAKITAWQALEQNRMVMAVPGNIYQSKSFGCNQLIKQGAVPVISLDDILFELGEKTVLKPENNYQAVDVVEKRIIEQLTDGPRYADEIITDDYAADSILRGLNNLQLKSVIEENGGRWQII